MFKPKWIEISGSASEFLQASTAWSLFLGFSAPFSSRI